MLTAAGEGTATIRVTATDPGGLTASQSFAVTAVALVPFTDHPIVPGVTPIRADHTELRARIDGVRRESGRPPVWWTDPVLTPGATQVRLAHVLELRAGIA